MSRRVRGFAQTDRYQAGRARSRSRAGRRYDHARRRAAAKLVRAVVPAQDRSALETTGRRRGAGARAPARRQRDPAGAVFARRQGRRHARFDRARHPQRAARLRGLRGARRLGEAFGQCAGVGFRQAADRADPARRAAKRAELAGAYPRGHRRRSAQRSQDRQRRRRRVARARLHAGARRFRRRLFVAGAVAAIAVQRIEDRPQLRHQLP